MFGANLGQEVDKAGIIADNSSERKRSWQSRNDCLLFINSKRSVLKPEILPIKLGELNDQIC